MLDKELNGETPQATMPLLAAADLQDSLLTATNDLDRLERLLADATQTLMGHFYGASAQINQIARQTDPQADTPDAAVKEAMQHLGGAVTALQFQDMASQLILHTNRRLRNCADRIARDVMGEDDGRAVVEEAPLRPNPVTQDEMDAGSIDLF